MMYQRCCIVFILLFLSRTLVAQINESNRFVTDDVQDGYLPLVIQSQPIPVVVSTEDWAGVQRAVHNLREDFQRVTSHTPGNAAAKYSVIIGTLGHSPLIDNLVQDRKIDPAALSGKNEKFLIQLIAHPMDGVDSALVIAGSDKRGTIYGTYELSAQIGVSPWYYWADAPIAKKQELYVKPGVYTQGEPAVRYRGIFLNDEYPGLTRWSNHTFGGYNSKFYEKVFELILRLKGNFLWPAMWGSAFYDDDPKNGALADEMGIVMSTSHHEPMARAQAEWKRYGNGGAWDYAQNKKGLQEFWKGGVQRTKDWETIVTMAMRGDGDEPMSDNQNISLLQDIVRDQRKIITQVTNKKAAATPQVWALYKEVQDYYDSGMQVPDDVTLLFCDDNWGNVRKVPPLDHKPRAGGYGMYYHFDYVGAPRNSKWLNVSQVSRVWEQMNIAYEHGVDRIWVVNVGDLKPMEYPISFFLDMAWDPTRYQPANLYQHTVDWCAQQFGSTYAEEAARLIDTYTKYNHRVTPELLNHRTYSLEHYQEFETVTMDYQKLLMDAFRLYNKLPPAYRDSFDQLVLFPIQGMSNLYDLYFAKAKNDFYADKQDVQANYWADQVKESFVRDSLLTLHFNTLSDGKWQHMMDQVRIGYRSWNNPPHSIMPSVRYVDSTGVASSKIFLEQDGHISIEARNFFRAQGAGNVTWEEIPNLGKTVSAITTLPITAAIADGVSVEYKIKTESTDQAKIHVLTSPTLNFNANKGLRYAISVDDAEEVMVNINGHYRGELGKWQAERIIDNVTEHHMAHAGEHTIRIRPLDHGIVIQKIMIDFGGLLPSYLGAPQSKQQ